MPATPTGTVRVFVGNPMKPMICDRSLPCGYTRTSFSVTLSSWMPDSLACTTSSSFVVSGTYLRPRRAYSA